MYAFQLILMIDMFVACKFIWKLSIYKAVWKTVTAECMLKGTNHKVPTQLGLWCQLVLVNQICEFIYWLYKCWFCTFDCFFIIQSVLTHSNHVACGTCL